MGSGFKGAGGQAVNGSGLEHQQLAGNRLGKVSVQGNSPPINVLHSKAQSQPGTPGVITTISIWLNIAHHERPVLFARYAVMGRCAVRAMQCVQGGGQAAVWCHPAQACPVGTWGGAVWESGRAGPPVSTRTRSSRTGTCWSSQVWVWLTVQVGLGTVPSNKVGANRGRLHKRVSTKSGRSGTGMGSNS